MLKLGIPFQLCKVSEMQLYYTYYLNRLELILVAKIKQISEIEHRQQFLKVN